MPLCNNCGVTFPNHVTIEGKRRNLQKRKFCLDCSPFGNHNTKPDINKTTPSNSKAKAERQKLQVYKKRKENMKKATEYKGGKCQLCGYNKCQRALTFHHLDPSQKSFEINERQATKSWANLKAELDKCVLLCFNCHMEVESGITSLACNSVVE